MNKCSHSLWYNKSANNFNEALPLGNGRIGAMVYGGGANETFTLNEDTLWSGYPRVSTRQCNSAWKRAQQLVAEKKYLEAADLLEQEFADYNVQAYLPLGKLRILTQHETAEESLRRQLDLDTACHHVTYACDGGVYHRECFISHPHQVMAIRIWEESGKPISIHVSLEGELAHTDSADENTLYIHGNCPDRQWQPTTKSTQYHYFEEDARKGVGYRAGVRVCHVGGSLTLGPGVLSVKDASEVFVYFALRTSFNGSFTHPVLEGKEYRHACAADLEQAVKLGYDALKAAHVDAHKALYDRCSLELGSSENSCLPTDERLEKLAQGQQDPALYALLFHFGRYLMIAGSRPGTQPTNLQGIWNDNPMPPWSSNYTTNINTEMNYWPAMSANLAECVQPLLEMIKDFHKVGQITARNYYDAPGFCVHHNSDLWRSTHPAGLGTKNSCQWGQWPMAAGWLCRMAFDVYRYSKDYAYLKELLPILEDCAAFYTAMLVEKDGYLLIFPSTSPENNHMLKDVQTGSQDDLNLFPSTYREKDAEQVKNYCPLDDTTTMSIAITRDVLLCAAQARELLGLDGSAYRETESHLPPYRINTDGTLNEWYSEYEDWDLHHRHVSHLYGLYPSEQIRADTPELMDACRATLEKRGDESTGWSLAWKINLWARLRDGDRAQRLLNLALAPVDSSIKNTGFHGGSYPNLFCAHPPFQIDGNFGACAGILEMLVQTGKNGEPVLLPALPRQWKNGTLTGMRLPGNRTLSMTWRDGAVTDCKIEEL